MTDLNGGERLCGSEVRLFEDSRAGVCAASENENCLGLARDDVGWLEKLLAGKVKLKVGGQRPLGARG